MEPKSVLKSVNWDYVEWDTIPTPGEVYVIVRPELDRKYIKIGDGIRKLDELPYINTSILDEEEYVRQTCSQCGHLCVINRNKIYAVCDETGKVFELWRMDTRDSDACKKFIPKRKRERNAK